jgi:hypothetical protein
MLLAMQQLTTKYYFKNYLKTSNEHVKTMKNPERKPRQKTVVVR